MAERAAEHNFWLQPWLGLKLALLSILLSDMGPDDSSVMLSMVLCVYKSYIV
jgi:hypothetical protein